MEDLRARHLRDLTAATAYITLMFAEEPRYRRLLARYVYEALKGRPRSWRREGITSRPRIVPRWRTLLARLSGPLLYARSRYMGGANGRLERPLRRVAVNGAPRSLPRSWRGDAPRM